MNDTLNPLSQNQVYGVTELAQGPEMLRRASAWCYDGVWALMTKLLLVPREPPSLPATITDGVQAFRPSIGYLNYLKLGFYVSASLWSLFILGALAAIIAAAPPVGMVLAPFVITLLIIVPLLLSYLTLYLHYDSTWYVLSNKSMRIRKGIWVIHETTLTFENIQNVSFHQGPLQRYFGFSHLLVETAGGGAAHGPGASGHKGMLEGLANAQEVRDLIMNRVKQSRSAGLGDEKHSAKRPTNAGGFSPQHLALLREISELTARLAAS